MAVEAKIIWPDPGRYILAVSGGADSMVLLNLFADASGDRHYEVVVAHMDHGLRDDSAIDLALVKKAAASYGLGFESTKANLADFSEQTARVARHTWLAAIKSKHQAEAVITAHHADDLIETSLLNLSRGTGHRGLAPMQDGPILRPLIHLSRAELRDYASAHKISWHEDKTNLDLSNPRNFIRYKLLPSAAPSWRRSYLEAVLEVDKLNKQIAQSISVLIKPFRQSATDFRLPKSFVRDLSFAELEEVIIQISLALDPGTELDRRIIEEIALFMKTAIAHKYRTLRKTLKVVIDSETINILTD